jgi:hypothetical protein
LTTEEIAQRFVNARPGFALASYAEVGLPFYRISVRLQILEHKELDPLQEYTLRAIDAGIDQQAAIEQALGLDANVVHATMVGLLEREAVSVAASSSDALSLTAGGKEMLAKATQIVSRERVVDIDYDGLLREPTAFLSRYLEPRQLAERGIREVPPHPARRPDELELRSHLPPIEGIIRAAGGPRQQLSDVLAVRGIERRLRIFQPAIALVYLPHGARRSQGQVAFAIAGQLSERHGQVFAEAGLARKLGLATRGIEDARTLASRVLGADLVDLIDETPTDSPQAADGTASLPAGSPVRAIETYEHPAILAEALETSAERILLLSPWLRAAVIDDTFLEKLAAALERRVEVYLGWGMSVSETTSPDADKRVLEALTKLSSQHERFHFKRLGRTHAKVLICDRRFIVVTSFNWLSFKGDPKRTFRDERGTMVSIEDHINEQFENLSARFR